jgi:acetyl esterase/lipase
MAQTENLHGRPAAGPWLACLISLTGAIVVGANLIGGGRPPQVIAAALALVAAVQATGALAAAARPTPPRLLAAAAFAFAGGALWRIGQVAGFPAADGGVWRLEATGFPDLYPTVLDLAAAAIFAAGLARRWPGASARWGRVAAAVVLLAAAGVAVAAVGGARVAQILPAILVLDGGVPDSLLRLGLPAAVAVLAAGTAGAISPRVRAATGIGWLGGLALAMAVLPLTLFGWGGAVAAQESGWFSPSTRVAATPGSTRTLAYCWPDGRPLAMDLSEPAARGRPWPVAVYIHGGETLQGSRNPLDGSVDGPWFVRLRESLVARGFAVAAVDYRLSPFNPVRDEIQDARCALAFLRANAGTLGLDARRIGAYGPSQGGYLSSMLGLTGQVQAVVDMWGPADLGDFRGSPGWVAAISGVPAHPNPALLARIHAASPLYNVTPAAPPFLIIHGEDDWFVAPHHSRDLAARLTAAGADVTLIPVRGDAHGLAATSSRHGQDPQPQVLVQAIADFFSRTLGQSPVA